MRSTMPIARVIAPIANEMVEARLRQGRSVQFTISTLSMSPILMPGDRVLVCGKNADELSIGDIVLARAGDAWLAHRLIARRVQNGRVFLVTQGDNAAQPDPFWSAAQVVGRVVAIQRDSRIIRLDSRRAVCLGLLRACFSRAKWFLQCTRDRLPSCPSCSAIPPIR